jgi:hypothetical protein
MMEIARDAPGPVACGRSGLPLLAVCPNWHRRTVPIRLLKTSEDDRSLLYGRPFKCRACGSGEVNLFAIESQAELDGIQAALDGPRVQPRCQQPTGRVIRTRALSDVGTATRTLRY